MNTNSLSFFCSSLRLSRFSAFAVWRSDAQRFKVRLSCLTGKQSMRILIVGAGATGGYFGARLAQAVM